MIVRSAIFLLGVGLVALSGCGPAKLDVSKSYELEGGDSKVIILDAQSKPQKITVEYDSGAELTVMLIKASDAPAGEEGFAPVAKAIVSEKGKKTGTLSGDVPEKTEAKVIVRNPTAKTTVKVRVTNQ